MPVLTHAPDGAIHDIKLGIPTELKVVDDGQGIVEAIVSVTAVKDSVDDIIEPGAYADTLKARMPKACWSHEWQLPVGKTLAIEELMPGDPRLPAKIQILGGGGLWVRTQFNLNTQRGRDAYQDVKFFGEASEWSIGYQVPVGGSSFDTKTGIRYISKLDLFEYSPVLFGANAHTATLSIKGAERSHPTPISNADWDYSTNLHNLSKGFGFHTTTADVTETLRKAFAWSPGEIGTNEEEKGSRGWSFLHHFVTEKGEVAEASTQGCLEQIELLNADLDLSEVDKRGLYEHLTGHLVDGGVDPESLPALKAPPVGLPDESRPSEQIGPHLFSAPEGAEGEQGADAPCLICGEPRGDSIHTNNRSKDGELAVEEKPYHIEKRNGKYCVVNSDTDETVPGGAHATRADALDHMRALYANVPDAGKGVSIVPGAFNVYTNGGSVIYTTGTATSTTPAFWSTTGTNSGTSSAQKIGFFGSTPITDDQVRAMEVMDKPGQWATAAKAVLEAAEELEKTKAELADAQKAYTDLAAEVTNKFLPEYVQAINEKAVKDAIAGEVVGSDATPDPDNDGDDDRVTAPHPFLPIGIGTYCSVCRNASNHPLHRRHSRNRDQNHLSAEAEVTKEDVNMTPEQAKALKEAAKAALSATEALSTIEALVDQLMGQLEIPAEEEPKTAEEEKDIAVVEGPQACDEFRDMGGDQCANCGVMKAEHSMAARTPAGPRPGDDVGDGGGGADLDGSEPFEPLGDSGGATDESPFVGSQPYARLSAEEGEAKLDVGLLAGSFESMQAGLHGAVQGALPSPVAEGAQQAAWVEATFGDSVLVSVVDFSAPTDDDSEDGYGEIQVLGQRYFSYPYTNAEGTLSLGEPTEVQPTGVLVPKGANLSEVSHKTLGMIECKIGRTLSNSNASRIRNAVEALLGVLDEAGISEDAASGEIAVENAPKTGEGVVHLEGADLITGTNDFKGTPEVAPDVEEAPEKEEVEEKPADTVEQTEEEKDFHVESGNEVDPDNSTELSLSDILRAQNLSLKTAR